MTFKAGDMVRVLENGELGEVLEVDGNTVYVEMMNGVEHDYPADKLMSDEAFAEKLAAERDAAAEHAQRQVPQGGAGMFGPYIPRRGDNKLAIDCLNMIGRVSKDLLEVADTLIKEAGRLDDFEKARPLNKVMMISEVLNVPTIVFMGAAETSDDGLMRQVIAKIMFENPGIFLLNRVKKAVAR